MVPRLVVSPIGLKHAEWSVTEQNDWVPWVKGGGSAKFWDLRSDFRDFLGLKDRKFFYCLFAPQARHYWLGSSVSEKLQYHVKVELH